MNNLNNKLIETKDIEDILNKHLPYEVTIKNTDLFQKAFVHKSMLVYNSYDDEEDTYCVFDKSFFTESYERIEFFGDSCLNLVAAEYIFDKFPSKKEGFMTKLRTRLVRNTQLAYLGAKLNFNKWLLISNHVEKISGRTNERIIEDVFESFIGCVYKELGFGVCKDFIFNVFDTYIDIDELVNCYDNYKDTLLRFFQSNCWKHPLYITIKEEGNVYNKKFITCVVLDKTTFTSDNKYFKKITDFDFKLKAQFKIKDDANMYIAYSEGKTKKESQQNVSKKCLEILNVPFDF